MRMLKMMIVGAALVTVAAPLESFAQSTGSDWNGSFSFRSPSERVRDLAQAQLIRRGEDGNFTNFRDRVRFDAFAFSVFTRLGTTEDDFYQNEGGFVSVDRSGDFWSNWSVGGVAIGIR